MKLSINTSDSKKITVLLGTKKLESISHKNSSQKLLSLIQKITEDVGIKISDLKEIEVNTGPGSFTGIRVGVSVAQALGWSFGIPVNGKKISKGEGLEINYD